MFWINEKKVSKMKYDKNKRNSRLILTSPSDMKQSHEIFLNTQKGWNRLFVEC